MLIKKVLWLVVTGICGVVTSHGDIHMGMEMGHQSDSRNTSELIPVPHEGGHMHGLPILETSLTPAEKKYWEAYNTTTYFSSIQAIHSSGLVYHMGGIFIVTVFTYPICLVLANVKSQWYLPMLCLNYLVLGTAIVGLSGFSASFPETLYPGNIYGKMTLILILLSIVQGSAAVVVRAAEWMTGETNSDEYTSSGRDGFIPLSDLQGSNSSEGKFHPSSPQHASITGSSATAVSNNQFNGRRDDDDGSSTSVSFDIDESFTRDIEQAPPAEEDGGRFSLRYKSSLAMRRDTYLSELLAHPTLQQISMRFGHIFRLVFRITNLPMLLYLLVYMTVGVAVGNLLGQDRRIFNLLAHWIKGGVFILLGLISLARYSGAWSSYGWAWNKTLYLKSDNTDNTSLGYRFFTPRGTITMEAVESFLIFFYGSTNIFLERLANPHGKWAAKDLQHVSIAFMFIGSGLCGLIAEHRLNDWRWKHAMKTTTDTPESAVLACSPGYSPNPFPAFTIFWTGILMSQHAQASKTSTAIHVQWGYLLSYGSFFRIITFILLMLVPNKNLAPSHPFTELIASFCLICGGLIFMESTDQVVEAIEYRGLTPMFTLNISIGIVLLAMAWEMMLFMWRDSLRSNTLNYK
ncbi:Tvs1p Ecym_2486 [Eremothecium cymbalariae DBVPG|uniref:Protein YTP1-like C-terminal domain-containing protein n=1 Tax=Eremothecium cymbalariae (strain CBS 270.75 / DBVPG 7215 / KCTC 17166 / NRRL Y-17582) TaxID=931890 RepID=G8JPV1_ERECY|nr:Hypothetical protein Ecym_2486 [Eremothecium cymbalariae DBVPG\